jgi:ectoine synthase
MTAMTMAFDPVPQICAPSDSGPGNRETATRITPGPRAILAPANEPAPMLTTSIPETKRGPAAMISRQKEQIRPATDHVLGGDWTITPLLTAGDNVGLEMADMTIQAGYSTIGTTGKAAAAYYCLNGEAIFRNLETQTTHYFRAGSLWTIPPQTRFRFTALFEIRLIAVAPVGRESDSGADDAPYFPLLNK